MNRKNQKSGVVIKSARLEYLLLYPPIRVMRWVIESNFGMCYTNNV